MRITTYKTLLVKDSAINYTSRHGNGDACVICADDAGQILRDLFRADQLINEELWQICLNCKGRVIGVFELATGTKTSCYCDAGSVARNALLTGAHSVILAHNHPSGDSMPSRDDISATRRAAAALDLVGVKLLDHVIIGDTDFSIRSAGLM